jgi:uncharacterized membrane protein
MRVWSHLVASSAALARRFPSHVLTAIEDGVEASEKRHRAEIRVAIETALDLRALWRVKSPRQRALEVFAELEIWNTRERNGVLIYILLAERDVEIVADVGFDGRVEQPEWSAVCEHIERDFGLGRWRDGVLAGLEAVTALATREFPATEPSPNEQQNRPAIF